MTDERKRIRVMFSIGSLQGGGSERQLIGILKRLDRSRFEPMLFLVYRSGELLPEVPDDVPVFASDDSPPPRGLPLPGRLHRHNVRNMAACLKEHKPDVVYDRTWHMTVIAAGASKAARVPRVSNIVTDPPRDFPATAGAFHTIKFHMLKQAYREADQVIAVSHGVGRSALRYYDLGDTSIRTVYNFIDLGRIDQTIAGIERPAAAEKGQPFRIVTAGRLHPQKGMIFLMRAVDGLVNRLGQKQIQLDVLGDGELDDELREFVTRKGLAANIAFHGYQPNAPEWFRQAHLFCMPSLYEGMPNALIEAMASGVPCLSTDCPSGPYEVLEGGRFGKLVALADPGALAQSIFDAIRDYPKWQEFIDPARRHIERTYSPEAGIEALQHVLEDVVRRAREGKG